MRTGCKVKALKGNFHEKERLSIHGTGTSKVTILNYSISRCGMVSEYPKPSQSGFLFDEVCKNLPKEKTSNYDSNVE